MIIINITNILIIKMIISIIIYFHIINEGATKEKKNISKNKIDTNNKNDINDYSSINMNVFFILEGEVSNNN
jgi:hypothetical protein